MDISKKQQHLIAMVKNLTANRTKKNKKETDKKIKELLNKSLWINGVENMNNV